MPKWHISQHEAANIISLCQCAWRRRVVVKVAPATCPLDYRRRVETCVMEAQMAPQAGGGITMVVNKDKIVGPLRSMSELYLRCCPAVCGLFVSACVLAFLCACLQLVRHAPVFVKTNGLVDFLRRKGTADNALSLTIC